MSEKPQSYFQALKKSFQTELPYWVIIYILALILTAIDSPVLSAIGLVIVLPYFVVGVYIVFVKLKIETAQKADVFDFKGAATNVYRAFWWPWYFLNKSSHKKSE